MKKTLRPLLVFSLVLNLVLLFSFFSDSTETKSNNTPLGRQYNIQPVTLPDSINFAGEPAPLQYFDVREGLDREMLINIYWQSQTLLFIKRANRYFPVIEKILKENNIPEDFKYIPLIESGFLHIVSPADATGYWQFIETTAKEYGLEVNGEVDERYHLEKATRAACLYFRSARELFGNWTMAAASFNIGRTELKRQSMIQATNNYYDLKLNNETGRYIYRILAIKQILSQPAEYGFRIQPSDLYPELKARAITVDTTITSITVFARKQGISYKLLKLHNPWLRADKLTNMQGKQYTLYIPESNSRSY